MDFGDFDPHAPPPMTEDKADMIEVGRHPAEDWLRSFVESELFEQRGRREVYTLGELCALYRGDGTGGPGMSPNGFGAYVRNAGMLKRIVRENGKAVRLVAVTNLARWRVAKGRFWMNELYRAGTPKKGAF
jgi:hypothetical protein